MVVDNIGKRSPKKTFTANVEAIRADTLKKVDALGLDDAITTIARNVTLVTGDYKTALKRELVWLKRRQVSERAMAAHNERMKAAERSKAANRIEARRRVKRKPFDPEAGRYRMARPLPDATRRLSPGFEGYPSAARIDCPVCGVAPAAYLKYGRYICAVDRLSRKGVGCGHRWTGPMNPSEARRIEERRRMGYGTEPPEPMLTESMTTGTGYPPAPKEMTV